jgi:hypothetical protein
MAQSKPKRFLPSFEDIQCGVMISIQDNTAMCTDVRALRKVFVLAFLATS